MLDSTIKSIISNARNVLVGKVPNPQSQVDLITIAMIYKFMDDMDNEAVEFGGKRSFFKNSYNDKITREANEKLGNINLEPYAWHKLLSTTLGNEARISLYSEALDKLQLSKQIPELFRRIFKGAFLPFRDGATLTMFLKEINHFSYDNSENLGNAFEFLLSIMGSQGDAGQFRTPRHIIDFIVDVVNPTKDDTILDPACGTAGFLISAYKHILKHNSKDFDADNDVKLYASKTAESADEVDIEISKNLRGDLLNPAQKAKLTKNVVGYDISSDMQKLALVNLYLHGFKEPNISEYDTLTSEEKWGDDFDVILANPPFMTPKGGIIPHKKFSVKANRSEVLFVDYIIEHLTLNGRAGVIVPEGIVFQSATAYKALRKKMVDENYLYAVVSLPSGVFNPYSGVKTSILLFDRQIAKRTNDILFVDVKNDGFDLGANRRAFKNNDLPEAFKAIREFQLNHCNSELISETISKSKIANLVPKNIAFQAQDILNLLITAIANGK
jgi:type I restriction enzyme M protein